MASGIYYIVTNRPYGVFYTGVTTDIGRRDFEHRDGSIKGFASRYGLRRLLFYEEYPLFMDAVQREKNIKYWPRKWKIELIGPEQEDDRVDSWIKSEDGHDENY
jgi:putative endonuclease